MTDPSAGPDTVVLELPASAEFVSVLRGLATTLAARCDLTVDEIDDLRIAVDEAGGLLLPHAIAGTPLQARFQLTPGGLEITAMVCAESHSDPDRLGFAWTVLEAVADELEVGRAEQELSIRIVKRREILAQ